MATSTAAYSSISSAVFWFTVLIITQFSLGWLPSALYFHSYRLQSRWTWTADRKELRKPRRHRVEGQVITSSASACWVRWFLDFGKWWIWISGVQFQFSWVCVLQVVLLIPRYEDQWFKSGLLEQSWVWGMLDAVPQGLKLDPADVGQFRKW